MKLKISMFLASSFIITIAVLFSTLMFLTQMHADALKLATTEQEQAIRTFWQLLYTKGKEIRVVDDKMLIDDYELNGNFELPDKIRSIFGGTATIFLGNRRISTNVLMEDGRRAVGTLLTGPAYDAVFKENRSYRGEALILGTPYFTAYDPIHDAAGKTLGVLYVGIKKTDFLVGYEQLKARTIAGSLFLEFLLLALAWKMLKHRLQEEARLLEVARILSETTGDSYFSALVENLSRLLKVEFAFIGELTGEHKDTVQVIAAYGHGKAVAPYCYRLAGTPCAEVIGGGLRFYADGVARRYPNNRLLDEMNAEGFLGMPLKLADGSVVGILAVLASKPLRTLQDTEPIFRLFAVRAAAELDHLRNVSKHQELAKQMQLITDSVPVNISYVDEELRYRFVNRGYEEWFGLPREVIVGRSIEEMRTPEEYAKIRKHVETALSGERTNFISEMVRRDGTVAALMSSYVPHEVADRVIGFFVLVSDITASRLAEQSLRESEERYRTLFNTTGTATFVSEEDTTVSLVNDEFLRLSGYARQEVEGVLRWTEFVTRESREKMLGYHHARRIDALSAPQTYECDAIWHDGSLRNMLVHANLIAGTGRSIISFLDITDHKRLEADLQSQLSFFQTLIDTMPSPVFYKNRQGHYTGCNIAFSKYLGYSREALIGKTVYDLAPEDLADRYYEMDEALFANPGVQVYDASVIYADGSRHEVTFNKATFQSHDGQVEGLVGVILDITERKRAEKWLAGEKAALEMIVQNAPLAEVLKMLCKNFEGQFPEAICSILLLEENGRRLRTIAAPSLPPEYSQAIDGTRIGPLVGSCGTAAFSNQVVVTADIATDPHWEKYRALPLRFGLQASWSMPVRSSRGAILGTFAVYHAAPHVPDALEQQLVEQAAHLASIIIERDRNEAALRESEERFHQIFVQKDDAILLIRLDNLDIIDVNPSAEELFGCSRQELLSLRPYHLITRDHFDALIAAIPSNAASEAYQLDSAEAMRRDGSLVKIAIRCKILLLHNEHVMHCSIRDITEKVQLEENVRATQAKLIHANKMTSIGMLASSVAHEINNPNNCISVNAAMFADVWKDAEPLLASVYAEQGEFMLRGIPFTKMQEFAPRLLNGITEGSRRITAIVKNMRDYVREDKGGIHGSVDVNQLIQNAVAILWHHIHIHTDNFTTDLDEDLPPVRGNGQQIEQVIINLITNALQSLPDKNSGVSVTTRIENGERIIISVKDDGIGMDANTLAHLTEPFFTTRSDSGGTGLGLYISTSIIKEHGGELEFKSTLGKGTIANVRISIE